MVVEGDLAKCVVIDLTEKEVTPEMNKKERNGVVFRYNYFQSDEDLKQFEQLKVD